MRNAHLRPSMVTVIEGTTLTPQGPESLRVGIEDDRFVDAPRGAADVSFDDGYLLPAAIDMHVHFREPGFEHKENIASGTRSAAFGGVALAVDMPNTQPSTTTVDAYEAKAERVEATAHVDVGLWAGVTSKGSCFELEDRATGYKLYAGPTTGDLLMDDPDGWERAVRDVAPTERPLAVHAEHPALLKDAAASITDWDEPRSHLLSRPGTAEAAVFETLAPLANDVGARLHGAHVSHPRSARILHENDLTSEVTPHHVLLDSDDVEQLGPYGKVNPPVRSPKTREALMELLREGVLGCVASDHAPHTREEKESGFQQAPSGMPGVETLYPLMLALALEDELPLARVLEACCSAPADVLGVPAGRLEPGRWANLVHVPAEPSTMSGQALHSKCGWSPFEEHQGLFPDALMVRGAWVLRDEALVGVPGQGRFVGGPGWR